MIASRTELSVSARKGGATRPFVLWLAGFSSVVGACAQEPSEICRAYVACQADFDATAGTGPVDTAQYQAGGLCWANAENADACDRQCADGIAANRAAAEDAGLDVPSCS